MGRRDFSQTNLAVHFQFVVEDMLSCPLRDNWQGAAEDAVRAGYAMWADKDELWLDDDASIKRIVK
jgi:hypothetical protein